MTVLFADVTGSTAMGEEMDPEEVRFLLSRYYELAKAVVAEHGGTLEKFIGDAVMAVFGLPTAHGDDAERGIAAALALRLAVQQDACLGAKLAVRFGVSTGEVVAARDQSAGDFLVTGDAVNVAARIQQAAESWQVLVTERTSHAAAGRFEFGPPLRIDARGKSAPISAAEVRGPRDRPSSLPTRPPLVGRDPDLEQLQLVARRAVSERRPSLVSLIAPAGTGKTRLLEEFLDWLPSLGEAVVATAQCLPYGQQMTYWPMRQVLFSLTGVSEDAEPAEIRGGIRSWLAEVGGIAADAELLAATIGMGETETLDRALVFAAWRDAIEAASRRAPVVIVFEDLHWSSDSLLDLVEFLMQPRGEAPIVMIALTRPELLDRRPAWGGGRRNHLALSLEPLSDHAVAELVRHLLDADSPELVATVVARSEGNPFYAGELVRSAIEQGSLDKLPDTVQATVLARLDLLPRLERRMLQVGAVFGRSFRVAGVATIEPELAEVAGVVAEALVARDLVRPSDGDRYAFRHILIREVAYGTLPRLERARLHADAADWLASRAEGREQAVAEVIAYHYREAAMIATNTEPESTETGRLRGLAVAWLERATEVAAAVSAGPEAVRHLRAALEFAAPDKKPALQERMGDLLLGGDQAVAAFATALEMYRAAGAPAGDQLRVLASRLLVVTRFQGSVANRMSTQEMAALRQEGDLLAEQTGDEVALARFRIAEGFFAFWLEADPTPKQLAQADRSANEGLALAERLGDPNLISVALDAMGGVATSRENWELVRQLARRRISFEDRLSLTERLDAYAMAGWSSCLLGDLDEAESVAGAGLALVRPGQVPSAALHVATWRLYALTLLGRWDEIAPLCARAIACWIEADRLAAGYALRGFLPALDVARARRDALLQTTVQEVVDEIVSRYPAEHLFHRLVGYGRGEPYLQAGQVPARRFAAEMSERSLSLDSDLGRRESAENLELLIARGRSNYPLLEAQAQRSLGLATGDVEPLRKAERLFRSHGAVPYAARAQHEIGRLSADPAALEAGRKTLQRLGDVDYLDRFDPPR